MGLLMWVTEGRGAATPMIDSSLFSASGFLIVLTTIPLFALIIRTCIQNRQGCMLGVYAVAIFLWGVASLLVGLNHDKAKAMFLWKWAYTVVLLLPPLYLHCVALLGRVANQRALVIAGYGQAFIFIALTWLGRVFPELKELPGGLIWVKATILYGMSFGLWIFVTLLAQYLLLCYSKVKPRRRLGVRIWAIAFVGYLGGVLNFIPAFDIDLWPFGNFLVPLSSLLLIYAVTRGGLLSAKKRACIQRMFIKVAVFGLLLCAAHTLLQSYFHGLLGEKKTFLFDYGVALLTYSCIESVASIDWPLVFRPKKRRIPIQGG
jgi:hypothetical protein